MDAEILREKFNERKKSMGLTLKEIEKEYGVGQTVLSKFANGKSGLTFAHVVKIWRFIYGQPFPTIR